MSVAREPDLYQCAVGHVGVYDMALMFRSGDIPDVRGGVEYLKLALGTDPELHYEQSPVNHVAAIKAALNGLEKVVLDDHLATCVEHALTSDDVNARREKVEELVAVLGGRKK